MKITKIKALFTLSTLLPLTLTPASEAATPRPVIGYTQTGSQWNLTLNGSPRFSLRAPSQLAPEMNQQFAHMSRTLNQLLEHTPIQKLDIRPVIDGQEYSIQVQHKDLFQIEAPLASGHRKSQLDFLLDTTNQLRRSFGNKPLRTFDRLQAHHLKGTIMHPGTGDSSMAVAPPTANGMMLISSLQPIPACLLAPKFWSPACTPSRV
jgi:hypothetical protein